MIKNRQTKGTRLLRKKRCRKQRMAEQTMRAYSDELKNAPIYRLRKARWKKEARERRIHEQRTPPEQPTQTKDAFLIGGNTTVVEVKK